MELAACVPPPVELDDGLLTLLLPGQTQKTTMTKSSPTQHSLFIWKGHAAVA